MDNKDFTEFLYPIFRRHRDWPAVVGRTVMAPDTSRVKMLKTWVFDMFGLEAENFSSKSNTDTFLASLLYALDYTHLLSLIIDDILGHKAE